MVVLVADSHQVQSRGQHELLTGGNISALEELRGSLQTRGEAVVEVVAVLVTVALQKSNCVF